MSSRLSTLMLMLMMIGGIWEGRITNAQSSANSSACKQERRMLVNACKSAVSGATPSPYCCGRLRVTRLECVCPIITPALAALIDVNRAVRIVQGCGRRVPRHYKCGSITTP